MWIFQILMMMMKVSIKEVRLLYAIVKHLLKRYTMHVASFLQN